MKTISHVLIGVVFLLMACMDEVAVDIPFDEPKLVVDALISSTSEESSVTIGWTFPSGETCYSGGPWSFPVPCNNDVSTEPYKVTGTLTLTEESKGVYRYPILMADRKSFIVIKPDIAGTPGSKFLLDIEINYENKTNKYHAETVMIPTPSIDHISYEIRKGDVGKGDNFVPLIYFREPQYQKNYYLFCLCEVSGNSTYCGNDRVWPYSIIRDEFLPANVNGLSIDAGATVAKYAEFYPEVYPGVGAKVKMYSINKNTYEFYKALLDQFNNDGGTFFPTPATPHGNISGNAIGLFRALHESSGVVFM